MLPSQNQAASHNSAAIHAQKTHIQQSLISQTFNTDYVYGMTEWWGAGMDICLEQGADLCMAQLMPLPLTVSCLSKIQTGFTFLAPAHPGILGQRAVKRVCAVCAYVHDIRRKFYTRITLKL